MMVRSGELCVIQRGMKFKVCAILALPFVAFVNLVPGQASRWSFPRMYVLFDPSEYSSDEETDIQEIFGSHYQLPELGPLGGHGLANARDFEHPVAHFDIDQSSWESRLAYLSATGNS